MTPPGAHRAPLPISDAASGTRSGPTRPRRIRTSAAAPCSDPRARASRKLCRFENAAPSDPERRFLLSAADYRVAEARADATGRALLGFYHSHPDHPAEPSAFDLAHAWPNLSYVILSVRDGVPGDMKSWRLDADRSRFAEETSVLTRSKWSGRS